MKRKPKIRWKSPLQGEPETWDLMGQRFVSCCDCGLVHMYYVKEIRKDSVIICSYRDDWLTKQARERKKK